MSDQRELALTACGGWLVDIARSPSPNCDERPRGCDIDLLVVHGISLPPGEFGGSGIDDLFSNRLDPQAHPYFSSIAHLRVSAHTLIRRDGQLVQYVPFSKRAWHAGASEYCGRTACNDFSIGVELEGTDEQPYADQQYTALSSLAKLLMREWPGITRDRIVGHSDIASDRKSDPGPSFDWQRLRKLIVC